MTSWRDGPSRVLILGGSSEASALARALADRPEIDAVISLAGRTATPRAMPLPTRVGGFGGVAGLVDYLRAHRTEILIDATHPFAERMSDNAWFAAERTGVPLMRLTRAAWTPLPGDTWREVETMADAAEALGPAPRRVFLTVGRLQLAPFANVPWHHYLVRTIDPVDPDHGLCQATFVTARGPFEVMDEVGLMRAHGIDIMVTKNSGGSASFAKIAAARNLGLPVILVRPPRERGQVFTAVGDVIAAIEAHARGSAPRGV